MELYQIKLYNVVKWMLCICSILLGCVIINCLYSHSIITFNHMLKIDYHCMFPIFY